MSDRQNAQSYEIQDKITEDKIQKRWLWKKNWWTVEKNSRPFPGFPGFPDAWTPCICGVGENKNSGEQH